MSLFTLGTTRLAHPILPESAGSIISLSSLPLVPTNDLILSMFERRANPNELYGMKVLLHGRYHARWAK